MSVRVSFDLPDEVAALLGSPEAAAAAARQALLLRLLGEGQLSQGQVARLLGISRWELLDLMARYHVPSGPQTAEEMAEDIANARRAATTRTERAGR